MNKKGDKSMIQHFRVARHTEDIEEVRVFYTQLVGLSILSEFNDHGYRGIMLGHKEQNWHLEFTVSNKKPMHHTDEEDVLVFYFNEEEEYLDAIERFRDAMIDSVKSINPYWDEYGRTYIDPDGYRIVICHKEWIN